MNLLNLFKISFSVWCLCFSLLVTAAASSVHSQSAGKSTDDITVHGQTVRDQRETRLKNSDIEALLESVYQHYILVVHHSMAVKSDTLLKMTGSLCTDTNHKNLDALKQAWRETMDAWAAVQLVNYGPIDDSNLSWRFQFWPDPMNLVARKFKSRIQGRNKKLSAPELAESSVAIQGLSALEYLLFDTSFEDISVYGDNYPICRLLSGSAENLLSNVQRVELAWREDYRQRWFSHDDTRRDDYEQRNMEQIFSGMVMSLGEIIRNKLGKPLGIKSGEKDEHSMQTNPFLLESWRSQQSLENLRQVIASVRLMYTLPSSFSDLLRQDKSIESKGLDAKIRQHFVELDKLFNRYKLSAFALIEQDKDVLVPLYREVRALYESLKVDYANITGIKFRFNAHDGD